MRVASLSPAVTEIFFSLGLQKRIVCTDQFSDFPEEAKHLPHLRGHQKTSIEELLQQKPELVFTSTVIQEGLSKELKAADVSCIHLDPRTVHAIYESIRQIGMLLRADRAAEKLVLSMQQGFNAVKKKSALLPSRPRVYVEEWPAFADAQSGRLRPPMVSGNWVPEVVRIAGCDPFPIAAGALSRAVALEEVLAFDPDMIVISWCGAGAIADPSLLTGREGWGDLRAVQERHVRVLDDSLLNRPGPRLVDGAQRIYAWAFEMLH
ncbi:hypothetical protein COU79_02140 [Candidatus Peregrinibacteria bacterium CG10_big_fil_rev_8_21_14_0_10_54_7]|nr:MAG: hypothetical protein COU79_02140 [Candidatus Peregrinibacteria bacterium CG10_big_fil_rev_8_21_14_0_10_54_7]